MTDDTKEPREPRKMPKNQRAYPKKGKPRLVDLIDRAEIDALQLAEATGDVSAPKLYVLSRNGILTFRVDAIQMRKWRALRNPPTSSAEHT